VNGHEEEPRSRSDERLLSDFLAGDRSAFASLTERYAEDLFRFVARFVRSSSVAEDLVQETFIQVFQSAAGFDRSRRLRPWLFTIAANKARDHLRERGRKKEVGLSAGPLASDGIEVSYLDFLSDESPSPLDAAANEEIASSVRGIVSQLPDHLREVLVLGYYQRLPYKEIAEILDVPLGTVKSRLHAAVSSFAEAYRQAEREGRLAESRHPPAEERELEEQHVRRKKRP